jgi:flagellar motor switch protein FliM
MMRKVLTQAEIEALLSSAPDEGGVTHASGADAVIAYNFRRPDRVSVEQIRSLHFLHDRFARNASSSLAAFLRTTTELSIVSVEQLSYSEFLLALPDPTAFYGVAIPSIDALGALELNPSVAFTIVDRLLGGSGRASALDRALTEIELDVVDAVVNLLIDHLSETWRPVAGLAFKIQGRETRPQMLQVAGRNEVIVLLSFDLKVGEIRGLLNLCLPAAIVETAGSGFSPSGQASAHKATPIEGRWLVENLGRVQMPVTSTLRTSLTARELLGLVPGQVLALGVPLHSSVDVRVRDIAKYTGHPTMANGSRAVRVQQNIGRPTLDTEATR